MYELPETKFTKGPWFRDDSFHTSINNSDKLDEPHKHICMVNSYKCPDTRISVDEEEHQGNVRLILQAPNMYALLELMFIDIQEGNFEFLRFNYEMKIKDIMDKVGGK